MSFDLGSDGILRASSLSLPWIEHGFSTRRSGSWPSAYTQVKQIHSDIVMNADGRYGSLGQGDGLITHDPGNWVGVRAADCVPLLLADPVTRSVAAVHAGWRGTVQQISRRAVEALNRDFGTQPSDLIVAIGPCIRICCFEVGEEVGRQFEEWFPAAGSVRRLDLVAANRLQLEAAGVRRSGIEDSDMCSYCHDRELLESFRRDKEASGRMVAAIRIRPEAQKARTL